MGAAMKIDEVAAMTMPNAIGTAKLATADPPQMASGSTARNAVTEVYSEHFQELLKEQGITCSMSRAGTVWDNSAMESFFSSLKTERTARKVYRSREQARADVFDYIERFYNPTRRHSMLGYVSPIQFEKAQQA